MDEQQHKQDITQNQEPNIETEPQTPEPTPELGILLVHGIGQSRSSDTLVNFGEPLANWIVDWVGGRDGAEVEIMDAVLGVEAEDPRVPAHTRVRITVPTANGQERETKEWLIAESWWAESFAAPSFAQLTNWAFKAIPWTLLFHFQRRFVTARNDIQNAWNSNPRRLWPFVTCVFRGMIEFASMLIALFLAPLLLFVITALLVIGLIPIPRVRSIVGKLQRGLASTIGDSYALLGPKIGSSAIYGRVSRDLAWLSEQVEKTAVIAHSQGAAIAYRAVTRDSSNKCRLLITFGAGIRKLMQIRSLVSVTDNWVMQMSVSLVALIIILQISRVTFGIERGLQLAFLLIVAWFGASFIAGLFAGIYMRIRQRQVEMSQRTGQLISVVVLVFSIAALTWWFPSPSRLATLLLASLTSVFVGNLVNTLMKANKLAGFMVHSMPEQGRPVPRFEAKLQDDVEWIDFYSSHDPVPNGAIFDGIEIEPLEFKQEYEGLTTVEVRNRASILGDHTKYWKNSEGFLSIVVGALGRQCGLQLEEVLPFDRERLILARHRRRFRINCLRLARYAFVVTAILLLLGGHASGYSEAIWNQVLDLLRNISLLGFSMEGVLPRVFVSDDLSVLVTTGLLALLGYTVVKLTWSLWEGRDIRELVTRGDYLLQSGKLYLGTLFYFSLLMTVTLGLMLAFAWISWSWWVYVLVIILLFMISSVLASLTPFQDGGLLHTWPELLKSVGASEAALSTWQERVRRNAMVIIKPVRQVDSVQSWQADLVLTYRPHLTTVTYDKTESSSLSAAIDWGKEHAENIYVLGNYGELIDAEAVLAENTRHNKQAQPDAGIADGDTDEPEH